MNTNNFLIKLTSYLHIENFSLAMNQCKEDVNTLLEYFTWIFFFFSSFFLSLNFQKH